MTLAATLQHEAGEADRQASSFERLAVELERHAAALGVGLDEAARAFTDDVWRGPAAERARLSLRSAGGRVRSAADELARVAALLRRRAGDQRGQAVALRQQASRVLAEEARLAAVPAST